jgi:hypothetical protein
VFCLSVGWPGGDYPEQKARILFFCAIAVIAIILPIDTWGNLPGAFSPLGSIAVGGFIWALGEFVMYYFKENNKSQNLPLQGKSEFNLNHRQSMPGVIPVIPCDISHHRELEKLFAKLDVKTTDTLVLVISTLPLLLHDSLFLRDRFPLTALLFSTLILALGSLLVNSEKEIQFQATGFAAMGGLLCIMPMNLLLPYQILLAYTLPFSFFYFLSLTLQCYMKQSKK